MADVDISTLGSVIKTAYEGEADTNAFDDAAVSKLGGIEAGAIANIVSDTTPQLGGMLDVNGQAIGDGTLEILKFGETALAVNEVTITNAATGNVPVISATGDDASVGISILPKGSGNVSLGTMTFDSDMVIGAGQDNYVLTYDDGTGLISLEAATGGGLANVVEDVTPQLGGPLDVNGQEIQSAGNVVFQLGDAAGTNKLSIQDSASAEVAYINSDGAIYPNSNQAGGGYLFAFNGGVGIQGAGLRWQIGNSSAGGVYNELHSHGIEFNRNQSTNVTLSIGARSNDSATRAITITGDAALPAGTVNVNGGAINITAGSSATGSGSGGNVVIAGGTGTSANGKVVFTHGSLQSSVADGASAVAYTLDTGSTYSTSGAKLLSLKNNTTEEASFSKDGALTIGPNATMNGIYMEAGNPSLIRLGREGVGSSDDYLQIQATNSAAFMFYEGLTDNPGINMDLNGVTVGLVGGSASTGSAVALSSNQLTQYTHTLYGDFNTSRDRDGSHLQLKGGPGGATNRNGGHVYLAGGENSGTGAKGVVVMATAHTVATLPGTAAVGMMARVTDANSPSVGSTVAGSGAAAAMVWYNGSAWTVIGV